MVTFHRISDGATRVMLQLEAEPEGIIEEVGDKLGVFDRRVEGDLKRFKEFVESRGTKPVPGVARWISPVN